jgi:hypothetical protein
MNDNHRPPLSEPDFDPHREGKRGFLVGAVAAAAVIELLWLLVG